MSKNILWLLYLLLLFLNAIAFLVYHFSHSDKALWLQLWEYANSDVCKLISASLLLPIILFYLESKFKLADTAAKNAEDRRRAKEQAHLEQVEREKQEQKSARRAVISDTIKLWDKIYEIATDIRCYNIKKADILTIDESLRAIYWMANSGEDVVNDWHSQFPNITLNETTIFLEFFNMILKSSATVAQSIRNKKMTDEELMVLQDSLGVILVSLKGIAHHPMIMIFKLASDLLGNEKDPDKTQQSLHERIEYLTTWFNNIYYLEKEQNQLLSTIEGRSGDEIRTMAREFEQWIGENPSLPPNEFNRYNDLQLSFLAIPRDKRFSAQSYYYSPEYVNVLADTLGFSFFVNEIERRGETCTRNNET